MDRRSITSHLIFGRFNSKRLTRRCCVSCSMNQVSSIAWWWFPLVILVVSSMRSKTIIPWLLLRQHRIEPHLAAAMKMNGLISVMPILTKRYAKPIHSATRSILPSPRSLPGKRKRKSSRLTHKWLWAQRLALSLRCWRNSGPSTAPCPARKYHPS